MKKDYFTITETTTEDDLKTQYHGLSRKYHPDMNPNDASFAKIVMQDINHQYDIACKNLGHIKEFNDMMENGKAFFLKLTGFVAYVAEQNNAFPKTLIAFMLFNLNGYIERFNTLKLRMLFLEYINKTKK